jgi:hypothetical protein
VHSFPSTASTIINDNTSATPYPNTINITGLPPTGVTLRTVTLTGLTHDEPQDLDIYLADLTTHTYGSPLMRVAQTLLQILNYILQMLVLQFQPTHLLMMLFICQETWVQEIQSIPCFFQ